MGIPAFLTFRDSALRLDDHKPECRTRSGPDPPPRNVSSSDPLKKDPLIVWQEMKQNGFLSPGLGVPPIPERPSSFKSKRPRSCLLNPKAKVAKREKIENFTRIAAPMGLLDKLEPGIIGRLRTSEQVFSIIKALVASDTTNEDRKEADDAVLQCAEHGDQFISSRRLPTHTELEAEASASLTVVKLEHEDCKEQILSFPSGMMSKSSSSRSNKELDIPAVVPSFSQDADAVSEWLQLIKRDIARRLAALKCSKTRIQEAIQIELPFLMSKEFVSNELDNQCPAGCCLNASRCSHQARWKSLFDQMEKALSEEEQLLEVWSNQVSEMQSQCKQSLHYAGRCAKEMGK